MKKTLVILIGIFILILCFNNSFYIKTQEINDKYKYKINIEYPKTNYSKLNKKIIKELKRYVKYFKRDKRGEK